MSYKYLLIIQGLQVEEGSVLCGNIGSEEQIIWTSSDVPYVVSYHNGMRDLLMIPQRLNLFLKCMIC